MKPRTAQPHDAPFILDIDTKTLDYYWTAGQWGQVWETKGVCILVIGEPPVGFCVMVEDTLYQEPAIHIPKLVVREEARGERLGMRLLAAVYRYCQGEGIERMAASVPLSNVYGCEWLKSLGFEAIRMESELLYGQEEDIVVFMRRVECTPRHQVL